MEGERVDSAAAQHGKSSAMLYVLQRRSLGQAQVKAGLYCSLQWCLWVCACLACAPLLHNRRQRGAVCSDAVSE